MSMHHVTMTTNIQWKCFVCVKKRTCLKHFFNKIKKPSSLFLRKLRIQDVVSMSIVFACCRKTYNYWSELIFWLFFSVTCCFSKKIVPDYFGVFWNYNLLKIFACITRVICTGCVRKYSAPICNSHANRFWIHLLDNGWSPLGKSTILLFQGVLASKLSTQIDTRFIHQQLLVELKFHVKYYFHIHVQVYLE